MGQATAVHLPSSIAPQGQPSTECSKLLTELLSPEIRNTPASVGSLLHSLPIFGVLITGGRICLARE